MSTNTFSIRSQSWATEDETRAAVEAGEGITDRQALAIAALWASPTGIGSALASLATGYPREPRVIAADIEAQLADVEARRGPSTGWTLDDVSDLRALRDWFHDARDAVEDDTYLAMLELGDDNGGPVTYRPAGLGADQLGARLYYDAASVFHSLVTKYASSSQALRAVAGDALHRLGETVGTLDTKDLIEYADGHLDEATDALGVLGNRDEYASSSIAQLDTRSGVRYGLEILETVLDALGWDLDRGERTIAMAPDALAGMLGAL